MHIPDGFINAPTAVATGAVAAGTVAYALKETRGRLEDRQVPMVALTGAFIFAVQMLNFPVGLGTSGHLIGGALAAILLGPWTAALVLSIVLLVQALLFADGGITALGANITLMGLVAGTGGYFLFRALAAALPRSRAGFLTATAVTAWASVVVASALCALFLLANGFPTATLWVMVGLHALIGIGEAVITTLVVGAVMAARPDLIATARLLPTARFEPERERERAAA
jgi:cobalt/nickel transport system permease protein